MQTRRELIATLGILTFVNATARADESDGLRQGRDRELLIEGIKNLADGEVRRARLVLETIGAAYPKSEFVDLANLILFYLLAREETDQSEDRELLRSISLRIGNVDGE